MYKRQAILNTPLSLDHVLTAELVWAASKSLLSGLAILLVIAALGLTTSPLALWVIPVIFLTGLAFAAMGLIVCALAPSYDSVSYTHLDVYKRQILRCLFGQS